MSSSLASYLKPAPASRGDRDRPLAEPPMRGINLPFPTPQYCGDFQIHIRRDGTWCYQNSPIHRKPLCRLFASVLHKDADAQHWLITPAERGRITVELAPFLVAQCRYQNFELQFKTTLDEWITLDKNHPLFLEQRTPCMPKDSYPTPPPKKESLPYFLLNPQRRLDALISRSVFYELAERAEYDENKKRFFIRSGEACFALAEQNPTSSL